MVEFLSKIINSLRPAPTEVHSKIAEQEKPISLASLTREGGTVLTNEDLRLCYFASALVNRAMRIRADLITSRNFTIEYPDSKSEKIIAEFLKNIKVNSARNLELKQFLRARCIDTDVFGNSYAQLVTNKRKTKIVKLAPRHPLYMDLQRDSQNKVILDEDELPLGYSFESDSIDKKDFKRKEIAHLVFETIGDEFLGSSLLLPIYKTIERLANIEYGVAQSLFKHGLPTIDVSVGDDNHPPTTESISDVFSEVKGMMSSDEYVHPYWDKVNVHNPNFPSGIERTLDYFVRSVVTISGIPMYLLLGAEKVGTRLTVQAMDKHLFLMLDGLQSTIKNYVESQIFRPVLDLEKSDADVLLNWHEEMEKADLDIARIIHTLAPLAIEGRPVISWKEARDLLKLPSDVDVKEDPEAVSETLALAKLSGIYLVQPHGELIWKGQKKAIVKSVKFKAHIGERLYLLSNDLCYGIIILDTPSEMTLKEFRELRHKHRISESERVLWWPGKKKLYYYPVSRAEMFRVPRKWKYIKGVQTFVSDVELLEESR